MQLNNGEKNVTKYKRVERRENKNARRKRTNKDNCNENLLCWKDRRKRRHSIKQGLCTKCYSFISSPKYTSSLCVYST